MTDQENLSLNVMVTHGDQQVSTVVDGEAVLMDVGSGRYYKLDDIGTRVWALIEKPTAIGAVCDQLVQEFEVERAACEADVLTLLERLQKCNLIHAAAPA
jgi:hypothetical protein